MSQLSKLHFIWPLVILGLFFIPTSVFAAPFPPLPPTVPNYNLFQLSTPEQITLTANEISRFRIPEKLNLKSTLFPRVPVLSQLNQIPSSRQPLSQFGTSAYNRTAIYNWTGNLSNKIDQPAQDPQLAFSKDRATIFLPPKTGRRLNRFQTMESIISALENNQNTFTPTVSESAPAKTLSSTNTLGINELIGRGESRFNGSPKNRRHNITVGLQKVGGIIIAPGEEFSFNKYLGEVDDKNGFLPELVIKKSGTVPEFGGGLCQVSSTLFRAAMHAGLPITQRRNHSYAVQYYAPQGTDATIYPGVIDFKFRNNTSGSILIWPYFVDDNTIIYDIYGTRDNRQVILNQPVTYDRKPDGSMKSTWTRTVTLDGKTTSDEFKSIYQPPALFHKQEEFVNTPAQTPTPPAVTPPTSPEPVITPNPVTPTTPQPSL